VKALEYVVTFWKTSDTLSPSAAGRSVRTAGLSVTTGVSVIAFEVLNVCVSLNDTTLDLLPSVSLVIAPISVKSSNTKVSAKTLE